jgi:lipid-A-disaccharide synthase-like uncharacterized protein
LDLSALWDLLLLKLHLLDLWDQLGRLGQLLLKLRLLVQLVLSGLYLPLDQWVQLGQWHLSDLSGQ